MLWRFNFHNDVATQKVNTQRTSIIFSPNRQQGLGGQPKHERPLNHWESNTRQADLEAKRFNHYTDWAQYNHTGAHWNIGGGGEGG